MEQMDYLYCSKIEKALSSHDPVTKQILISSRDKVKVHDTLNNTVTQNPSVTDLQSVRIICIDSVFQVIGVYFKSHYEWNKETKQLQHIHTFDNCLNAFGLIYIQKTKQLLLFGGFDLTNASLYTIYRFSLLHHIWSELDKLLPYDM